MFNSSRFSAGVMSHWHFYVSLYLQTVFWNQVIQITIVIYCDLLGLLLIENRNISGWSIGFASPSMRLFNPIEVCSQSVTHLISALYSRQLSSLIFINKKWWSSQIHTKVALPLGQYTRITINLFKMIIFTGEIPFDILYCAFVYEQCFVAFQF